MEGREGEGKGGDERGREVGLGGRGEEREGGEEDEEEREWGEGRGGGEERGDSQFHYDVLAKEAFQQLLVMHH